MARRGRRSHQAIFISYLRPARWRCAHSETCLACKTAFLQVCDAVGASWSCGGHDAAFNVQGLGRDHAY